MATSTDDEMEESEDELISEAESFARDFKGR
jgi:hypothetical protein